MAEHTRTHSRTRSRTHHGTHSRTHRRKQRRTHSRTHSRRQQSTQQNTSQNTSRARPAPTLLGQVSQPLPALSVCGPCRCFWRSMLGSVVCDLCWRCRCGEPHLGWCKGSPSFALSSGRATTFGSSEDDVFEVFFPQHHRMFPIPCVR